MQSVGFSGHRVSWSLGPLSLVPGSTIPGPWVHFPGFWVQLSLILGSTILGPRGHCPRSTVSGPRVALRLHGAAHLNAEQYCANIVKNAKILCSRVKGPSTQAWSWVCSEREGFNTAIQIRIERRVVALPD